MARDLTQGRIFHTILLFSLPIIGGNLFQLFYTLADTVIVGRTLGPDALAAAGSTGIVIYFVLCFVQGLTGGFGICLGHQFGRRNEEGMRQSIAFSALFCGAVSLVLTAALCLLSRRILVWMNTPEEIRAMAYDYMFIILLGTSATVFYNMISNILQALGDSRTPLVFLVFSSLLNIVLDLVFILPLNMGVAGAAWATVFSQLLSAALCTWSGMRKFSVLRLRRRDLRTPRKAVREHLRLGLTMGFQMSVMCVGQLAMQGAVNAMGAGAIAGYTAAAKVDQLSVLMNGALGVAVSNFTAQNCGARRLDRIRSGVKDSLLLASLMNAAVCAVILLCRHLVVPLFVEQPTAELDRYAELYFLAVAPFYLLLGVLITYRSAIQSMGNSKAPFAACVVELTARVGAATLLAARIGYVGVCLATPLAWIGADLLLIPVYFRLMAGAAPQLSAESGGQKE